MEDFVTTEGTPFTTTCVGSYYPVKLTWDKPEEGRKWELEVQSSPVQKIRCTGDEPARGEMAELLLQCGNMQDALLEIFMVLASVGRQEGEKTNKKDLFIIGGEGEGKIERAMAEAAKLGGYVFGAFEEMENPFSRGEVLNSAIRHDAKTIIIGGCPLRMLSDPGVKELLTAAALCVDEKGVAPKHIANDFHWIFIVDAPRYFDIVVLPNKGEEV